MSALIARGVTPGGRLAGSLPPAPDTAPPGPGLVPQGALVAFEFGQMQAETLVAVAALGPLRITPWRMVLVEGLTTMPDVPGVITDPGDPVLRVFACTGAPGCLQANGATRPLARALGPRLTGGQVLHVSGCAKGCAWPARAPLTIVATPAGYDLIRDGHAMDPPDRTALSPHDLTQLSEFS